MNEEIEYAEMLEIPVSTVSVTEKRGRLRKNKGDLKEKLISRVNKKAAREESRKTYPIQDEYAETENVARSGGETKRFFGERKRGGICRRKRAVSVCGGIGEDARIWFVWRKRRGFRFERICAKRRI